MIVFDLHCEDCSHVFEAWFSSSSSYSEQQARSLVACPMCGGGIISKAPMSPRVSAKSNQRSIPQPRQHNHGEAGQVEAKNVTPIDMVRADTGDAAKMQHLTERLAKAQSDMLKNSEWVGSKFADEARAIHYGEADNRSIHGEVSISEAKALVEEGVKASPLPFPVIPPKLQN